MTPQHQQQLSHLIDTAASTKDSPDSRRGHLRPLLTLLLASRDEPRFVAWLSAKLSDTIYPRPSSSRSLLDAALQAFMAAAPINCSYVLPTLLKAPGSASLATPLFRPNPTMHSSWPQQGMVCCSILACIATCAADQLHALQHQQDLHSTQQEPPPQQQQQQQVRSKQELQLPQPSTAAVGGFAQQLGTAVAWLTDCLVQAVGQHKLHLLQLALAAFVHRYNVLHQQQQQQQSPSDDSQHEPSAKRRRLQQQQQGQLGSQGSHAVDNAVTENPAALQAGLQLLCAVCSCSMVQCNTQQLLPLAAVVAAQAASAGARCDPGIFSSTPFAWLMLQLCSQVSQATAAAAQTAGGPPAGGIAAASSNHQAAATAVAAVAAGAATAAGGPPAAASTHNPQQEQRQQQPFEVPIEPGAAGLNPVAAWELALQHVAAAGPEQGLRFVQGLMGIAQPDASAAVAVGASAPCSAASTGAAAGPAAGPAAAPAQQPSAAPSAASSAAAAARPLGADPDPACFHKWLQEASKQWQQAPLDVAVDANGHGSGGSGRAAGRGRGSKVGASQQRLKQQVSPLRLEQLLPPARHVTASWVCKQLLPCLCRQASAQWRQQQQPQPQLPQQEQEQQQQLPDSRRGTTPAVDGLVQLLAADGLLLPASGEVFVSARAFAEALGCLEHGLQVVVVHAWQQQLQVRQEQRIAAAASGAAPDAKLGQGLAAPQVAGAAAAAGAATGVDGQHLAPLVPWVTLQPMLCVLNHLHDLNPSPVAGLLGRALCSCVTAAAAGEGGAATGTGSATGGLAAPAFHSSNSSNNSSGSSVTRDLLKHLLLPLRFKLHVSVRVWLLAQLLQCELSDRDTAQYTAGQHVLQLLLGLLTGECAAQLEQGLQWLAADKSSSAAAAAAVTARPASADLADTLVQVLGSSQASMADLNKTLQAANAAAMQLLL